MVITYNSRLQFKSQEDFSKIWQVLLSHQMAVNECSKVHFGTSRNSIVDLHAKFYRKFRDTHPEIPAQIVVRAINETLSSHRSIKSNKHKIKKPVEKVNPSIRLDKRLYTYNSKGLKLTSLHGRVLCDFEKYPKLEEFLANYRLCDPLLFIRNGEIWISLPFDIPTPAVMGKSVCGIDIGIKNFIATSEGQVVSDKKYNADKRKLRYLKRKLQSKNTKSSKKHLKKLRRKETNKTKNQIYKIVNYLIKNSEANVFAIEDLKGIKPNTFKKWNPGYNNKWGQIPVYLFTTILEYKALLNKKTTVKVNPRFTSQRDSRTGKKSGTRNKGRYEAKDGKHLHADINASINIAKLSKLPLSGDDFVRNQALLGQAVVNRPIVCKSSA